MYVYIFTKLLIYGKSVLTIGAEIYKFNIPFYIYVRYEVELVEYVEFVGTK